MHALLLDADIYDQIRETARRFAADVFRPAAADSGRDESFPADIYRQMGSLGLFGITVSEEHGGAGLDTFSYSIVMEELSRASGSVALSYGAHSNLCVNQISRNGNEAQKKKYLPKARPPAPSPLRFVGVAGQEKRGEANLCARWHDPS